VCRKLFPYKKRESVKNLQNFCGCLDMKHLYNLYRWKFQSSIALKLPFLSTVCAARELKRHFLLLLSEKYEYVGNSKL
jgi:hypothetical protein